MIGLSASLLLRGIFRWRNTMEEMPAVLAHSWVTPRLQVRRTL
ncbi:hypothetical protein YSA_07135 [Pseudomonas putida ND6]|uniref:Uncharacterized protein n=1 Tax=Pseudomonas putida ND6 TaxID=231023 RepID=I3UYQ3_PSEPU|nr:hypothetical protein YSA_07135 [Pseudomonas putida ND6]